ncbi:unnamed protein product [Coccothraustes coccothraustes]
MTVCARGGWGAVAVCPSDSTVYSAPGWGLRVLPASRLRCGHNLAAAAGHVSQLEDMEQKKGETGTASKNLELKPVFAIAASNFLGEKTCSQ